MILISIDPGTTSGVAIFVGSRLAGVAMLEGSAFTQAQELIKICNTLSGPQKKGGLVVAPPPGFNFGRGMIEVPRVYPQKAWKGDPNDLITVALVAGFLGHVLSFYYEKPDDQIEFIHPSTWKGQRPKKLDNDLTLSLLEGSELACFDILKAPKSKIHNVIDAVGIGLYGLQRR